MTAERQPSESRHHLPLPLGPGILTRLNDPQAADPVKITEIHARPFQDESAESYTEEFFVGAIPVAPINNPEPGYEQYVLELRLLEDSRAEGTALGVPGDSA